MTLSITFAGWDRLASDPGGFMSKLAAAVCGFRASLGYQQTAKAAAVLESCPTGTAAAAAATICLPTMA